MNNNKSEFYKIKYSRSERKALNSGFEEILDEYALNGRYFVKNGLFWIYDINVLKQKLHVINDKELFDRL